MLIVIFASYFTKTAYFRLGFTGFYCYGLCLSYWRNNFLDFEDALLYLLFDLYPLVLVPSAFAGGERKPFVYLFLCIMRFLFLLEGIKCIPIIFHLADADLASRTCQIVASD